MEGDRDAQDPASLGELLAETRILLPGTQVFLGFLTTLPFTTRFALLSNELRRIFVWTFAATLLASVLFSAPACYHRLARPIHHKRSFKLLANALVVMGMLPLSAAVVLVAYLVFAVVVPDLARGIASAVGVLVLVLWWLLPAVRLHDRLPDERPAPRGPRRSASGGT